MKNTENHNRKNPPTTKLYSKDLNKCESIHSLFKWMLQIELHLKWNLKKKHSAQHSVNKSADSQQEYGNAN